MKLYTLIILIIFNIQGICHGADSDPRSVAAEEIFSIIRNPERYDKKLMPYSNGKGPLQVKISMHILSIDIDDFNMRTNVDLYFRLIWNDPRLSYKSEVDSIRLSDTSDFWIPDAFFRNSFKTEMMNSVHPETMIRITKNGDVSFSARFYLSLKCPMNLKKFPHDQQSCPLFVESYAHSTEDVIFDFNSSLPLTLDEFLVSSKRFTLEKVTQHDCTAKTATGSYTCLSLLFSINRIFNGYLLEWYFPCVSLVIMAFLSQLLDPALILPRLLITVGPLLTLSATSLIYHQTLPSVNYVTAMDVFSGVSLFAIFSTVLHILISFYYSSEQTPELKKDEEGQDSKWKEILKNMKNRANSANHLVKLLIIGSYVLFLIVYFIAYNI